MTGVSEMMWRYRKDGGSARRGQVALITAFAMVVLIGIAALAIDLGFSWSLRRQVQNAVDPAALAAARWINDTTGAAIQDQLGGGLVGGPARQAACFYLRENGFFPDATDNDGCVPANDPYGAQLTVKFPPDVMAGTEWAGAPGSVQVILSSRHDTFFSKIFGIGSITIAEQAVATRQRGVITTNSLHVLDPLGCESLNLHGNPLLHIYPAPGVTVPGGYVQVNSECQLSATSDDDCSNAAGALRIDGTNAELYAVQVNVVGSCRTNQPDEPHPTSGLQEAASFVGDPLSSLRFPSWDTGIDGARCGGGGPATRATGNPAKGCGGHPSMSWTGPDCIDDPLTPEDESGVKCITLQPGVYYGGWHISANTRVNLQPGIYVIAGGGIDLAGGAFLDSLDATGAPAPVLIFNTDNPVAAPAVCPANNNPACQDDLDLKTNKSLQLTGLAEPAPCPPVTLPTAPDCPFGGMVIWYDARGSQTAARDGLVEIEGPTTLFVSGTIYAPYATVTITGNSTTNTTTPECPIGAEQVLAVQIVAWRVDIGGGGDLCMPYDPSRLYQPRSQGLVH